MRNTARTKDVSIRQLRADLSSYLYRAEAGEVFTVWIRNRPVARIVAIRPRTSLSRLRNLKGVRWSGGKPASLLRAEVTRRGLSLAALVLTDRRFGR
ncbi:MAG: type II toxin-antitoxin system Phd/YefM family antitoxin [Betaproteobacteria bacterium]